MHICELHRELQKARQEAEEEDRIRAFTAAARYPHDIATLAANGWNTHDIAQVYNVPLSFVQNQLSRSDRHRAARRKFMTSGRMPDVDEPGMPSVFTIYQR